MFHTALGVLIQRQKLLRRLLSAALLLFAGFRFYQLVAVLVRDPSGATLSAEAGTPFALALPLAAALPLHLTSVTVLLQRPYIPRRWGRAAWLATVISGTALGVLFLVRLLLLS